MTQLPRAMLIDMDDTILSAYGRPDIAWNNVAAEFAGELGAAARRNEVAAAIAGLGAQILGDRRAGVAAATRTKPGRWW